MAPARWPFLASATATNKANRRRTSTKVVVHRIRREPGAPVGCLSVIGPRTVPEGSLLPFTFGRKCPGLYGELRPSMTIGFVRGQRTREGHPDGRMGGGISDGHRPYRRGDVVASERHAKPRTDRRAGRRRSARTRGGGLLG